MLTPTISDYKASNDMSNTELVASSNTNDKLVRFFLDRDTLRLKLKEIKRRESVDFMPQFLAWFDENYFSDYCDELADIKINYNHGDNTLSLGQCSELDFNHIRLEKGYTAIQLLAEISSSRAKTAHSDLYYVLLALILDFYGIPKN